jgi:dTDP-4-amino-4,6-dideoxygalactose transaminase
VELALRGLGIAAEDEVALAGYDFAGNFRAIERVGARPVLLDIDPKNLAIRPELLPKAASSRLRAVIVSHLHSGMAPLREIMAWAATHGVLVVEDICQAHGAVVHGQVAGTWGDVAVLSFGGSKLITAGRGGAIMTRSAEYDQRLRAYAEQGNDAYPLSELQAAVVLPQWQRLDERNAMRRRQVDRLQQLLVDTPQLELATCTPVAGSPSYYKVAWWWRPGGDETRSRDDICRELQSEGIAMDAGFRGFVKRSARRCRRASELEVAAQAAQQLMVLHHPILLEADPVIDRLAATIRAVCSINGC